MKRKPSLTTIIASIALFVSLGGTGIAASHFLITSVSQIKPSVRHALRGHAGPQGLPGAAGAVGPSGMVDWDKTYKIVSSGVTMTTAGLDYATAATCSKVNDRMITGGFTGTNDAATQSEMYPRGQRQFPYPGGLAQVPPDSWVIVAHLTPGSATGFVQAWALCAVG